MRRLAVTAVTAIIALSLAATVPAEAQEGNVGLGLGLSTALFGDLEDVFLPIVYVPIVVSEGILFEPGIGMARLSQSDDDSNAEASFTLLSIGAGLLFATEVGTGDRVYVGPRVGVLRSSESFSGGGIDEDDSTTNLAIAGVAGGEFFLRSHFSLGGEIGLRWLKLDEGESDFSSSLLSTTAELRVRWYFP